MRNSHRQNWTQDAERRKKNKRKNATQYKKGEQNGPPQKKNK